MGGLLSKFRKGGRGESESVPPTPEGTLSRQHYSEPELLDVPQSPPYSSDTLHSTKSEGSQLRSKKKGKKDRGSKSASRSTLEGSREEIHPDIQQPSQSTTLKSEKGGTSSRSGTLDRSTKSGTLTKGGTLKGLFKTKSSTLKSNRSSGSKDSLNRRHRDKRESNPDEQGNFFTRFFRRSTRGQKKRQQEETRRAKSEEKELLTPRDDDGQQDEPMFSLRASSEDPKAAPTQMSETPLLDILQQDAETHNAERPDRIQELGQTLDKVLSRSQELILDQQEKRHQFLMTKTITTTSTSVTMRQDEAVPGGEPVKGESQVSVIEQSTAERTTRDGDTESLEDTIFERTTTDIGSTGIDLPTRNVLQEQPKKIEDSFEIIDGPEKPIYDTDINVASSGENISNASTADVGSDLETIQLEAQKIRGDMDSSSYGYDEFEIIKCMNDEQSDRKDPIHFDDHNKLGVSAEVHDKGSGELMQTRGDIELQTTEIGSTELFIDEGMNATITNMTEQQHPELGSCLAETQEVISNQDTAATNMDVQEGIVYDIHNEMTAEVHDSNSKEPCITDEKAAITTDEIKEPSTYQVIELEHIESDIDLSQEEKLFPPDSSIGIVFSETPRKEIESLAEAIETMDVITGEQLQQSLDSDLRMDVRNECTAPQPTTETIIVAHTSPHSPECDHVQLEDVEGPGSSSWTHKEMHESQHLEAGDVISTSQVDLATYSKTGASVVKLDNAIDLNTSVPYIGDSNISHGEIVSPESHDTDSYQVFSESEQNIESGKELGLGDLPTIELVNNTHFLEHSPTIKDGFDSTTVDSEIQSMIATAKLAEAACTSDTITKDLFSSSSLLSEQDVEDVESQMNKISISCHPNQVFLDKDDTLDVDLEHSFQQYEHINNVPKLEDDAMDIAMNMNILSEAHTGELEQKNINENEATQSDLSDHNMYPEIATYDDTNQQLLSSSTVDIEHSLNDDPVQLISDDMEFSPTDNNFTVPMKADYYDDIDLSRETKYDPDHKSLAEFQIQKQQFETEQQIGIDERPTTQTVAMVEEVVDNAYSAALLELEVELLKGLQAEVQLSTDISEDKIQTDANEIQIMSEQMDTAAFPDPKSEHLYDIIDYHNDTDIPIGITCHQSEVPIADMNIETTLNNMQRSCETEEEFNQQETSQVTKADIDTGALKDNFDVHSSVKIDATVIDETLPNIYRDIPEHIQVESENKSDESMESQDDIETDQSEPQGDIKQVVSFQIDEATTLSLMQQTQLSDIHQHDITRNGESYIAKDMYHIEASSMETPSPPVMSEDLQSQEGIDISTFVATDVLRTQRESDKGDSLQVEQYQPDMDNEHSQQQDIAVTLEKRLSGTGLVDITATQQDEPTAIDEQSANECIGGAPVPSYVVQEFVWEHGGQNVCVSGSFNDWIPVPMSGSGGIYKLTIELPEGRHYYRYTVDGETMANPIEDMEGELNVLEVTKQR